MCRTGRYNYSPDTHTPQTHVRLVQKPTTQKLKVEQLPLCASCTFGSTSTSCSFDGTSTAAQVMAFLSAGPPDILFQQTRLHNQNTRQQTRTPQQHFHMSPVQVFLQQYTLLVCSSWSCVHTGASSGFILTAVLLHLKQAATCATVPLGRAVQTSRTALLSC